MFERIIAEATEDGGALDPEQVYVQFICNTGEEAVEHDPEKAPDSHVRPAHAALHGQVFRLEDAPVPPLDYGCFLPGTRISGVIDGASRAAYQGKAVEILTQNGARLRVTANHPIPTEYGLVPASAIKPGWKVLVDPSQINGVAAQHPNKDDVPPLIEEIYDLAAQLWPVGTARVAPTDFHGDGHFINGQVDVVGSYELLRRVWDAEIIQDEGNSALRLGHKAAALPGRGLGDHGRPAGRLALKEDSACRIGGGYLGTAGSEAHATPLERFSRRLIAQLNAGGQQSVGDGVAGNAEALGERVDGRPLLVVRDEAGEIDWRKMQCLRLGNGPSGHASLLETGKDGLRLHPELSGEFRGTGPGHVFADEVIEVACFDYTGHVYDVRSPVGHVIADSVMASNCRCGIRYCAKPGTTADRIPDMPTAPAEPVTLVEAYGTWLDTNAPKWPEVVQAARGQRFPLLAAEAKCKALGYSKDVARMALAVHLVTPAGSLPGILGG